MVNTCTIHGNIGSKPELRKTQDGKSVLNFSLCHNMGKKGNEKPHWFRCTIWDKQADGLAPYLEKGTGLVVSGMMKQNQYEKDGVKREQFEITVHNVTFMGGNKDSSEPPRRQEDDQQHNDDLDSDIPF